MTCASCGNKVTCHPRKVGYGDFDDDVTLGDPYLAGVKRDGGMAPMLICNRCTREERRYMREHPNTPHRSIARS